MTEHTDSDTEPGLNETRNSAGESVSRGHRRGSEELRLLALVRDGDRQAFETLYRIYHPRLTRFLMNLVRRPQLVEEVLNDTLMVVWERADSFNGASKLSTWIFAIAYRKAMKALRRQDEAVEDTEANQRTSLEHGPVEACGLRKTHLLLLKAMNQLSPEHRAVVDLTYFHEMGYREIADILECPINTVKTRMFHARRHLRQSLAGELADWL
jgi:RNA polymerase sigma-70 factor (ECF subfamily)